MTSPFAKRAAGGGVFFDAKNHMNDLALLIEPVRILKDQPHEYEGVKSTRSVAVVNIAVFANSEAIETQTPSEILENAQITSSILVQDIETNGWIGEAACQVIRKGGRAYVWRDPEPEHEKAVEAYYLAREAEVAANLTEVPSFGDDD